MDISISLRWRDRSINIVWS